MNLTQVHAPRPTRRLSPPERDRALAKSLLDGALFAAMVGLGETYFVAVAVWLEATPWELGVVVSVPLLAGALGPLLVLAVLRRWPHRRPLVALSALGQGLLLVLLAVLCATGTVRIGSLLAVVCGYNVFGQSAGTAWSSWYGDLVPEANRGRYFARRTRLVHAATFLGLLLGGLLLEARQATTVAPSRSAAAPGFALVFGLAAAFRVASAGVLASSPEPRMGSLPGPVASLRFLATARGRNAWRLLLGSALFQLTAYVAAPFYTPYMLDNLGIGYAGYTAALGVQVAIKVLVMPYWGQLVDREGARRAFRLSMLLSALIPLPWLWIQGLQGVLIAHVWAGLAWGGFEITLFAFLLDSTVRRTRPLVFAAHNVVNGTGQVAGGMAGAGLVTALGCVGVFGASLAGRMLVALILPSWMRDVHVVGQKRRLTLRLVGLRPGSGVVHRPMLEPTEPPPTRSRPSEPDQGP